MVVKTDWLRAPDTRTTTDEREGCACVHDCFAARLSRPRQRRVAGEARAERLDCRAITMARTHARSDRAARQAAQRPAVSEANVFYGRLWFLQAKRAGLEGRFLGPTPSRRRGARGSAGARRMPRQRRRAATAGSDERAERPAMGRAARRGRAAAARFARAQRGIEPKAKRRVCAGQFDARPCAERPEARSAPQAAETHKKARHRV